MPGSDCSDVGIVIEGLVVLQDLDNVALTTAMCLVFFMHLTWSIRHSFATHLKCCKRWWWIWMQLNCQEKSSPWNQKCSSNCLAVLLERMKNCLWYHCLSAVISKAEALRHFLHFFHCSLLAIHKSTKEFVYITWMSATWRIAMFTMLSKCGFVD